MTEAERKEESAWLAYSVYNKIVKKLKPKPLKISGLILKMASATAPMMKKMQQQ